MAAAGLWLVGGHAVAFFAGAFAGGLLVGRLGAKAGLKHAALGGALAGALAWLIARMRVGHFTLLDCQFMTAHLSSLGAVTVAREAYVELLSVALGTAVGGVEGAGSGASAGALPPPDFTALDAVLEEAGADGASGPAGKVIAQLLGQTS